jgi:hypothetical protein
MGLREGTAVAMVLVGGSELASSRVDAEVEANVEDEDEDVSESLEFGTDLRIWHARVIYYGTCAGRGHAESLPNRLHRGRTC